MLTRAWEEGEIRLLQLQGMIGGHDPWSDQIGEEGIVWDVWYADRARFLGNVRDSLDQGSGEVVGVCSGACRNGFQVVRAVFRLVCVFDMIGDRCRGKGLG